MALDFGRGGSSLDSCGCASSSNTGRSFRQHNSSHLQHVKAYPLPHPMQFQSLNGDALHSTGNAAESEVLGFRAPSSKVVVVYDGEKKFTTTAVDVAIKGYAASEDDAIVVVAFLEHVLSPMGMRMVADMEQFSGVNDAVLKQAVALKKMEIESKIRETSRWEFCCTKKIHLDVKVLPGSNSKALVAKEVFASQATTVIFDKNAMKSRRYYEENLPCHVLRLRSDGRRVETVSLFGQRASSLASYSDSSSSASMGSEPACALSSSASVGSEPACASPSIWSKLNIFVSKSSSSTRHGSSVSSSSESGSPREQETTLAEALEESFSFDTPKVEEALDESFSFDTPKAVHEAYVYAAAGLDDYNRKRNRGTTALVA